ncbi:amidohydrolase family protein [Humisphaera borealis]|uniref:Amidohydrolase family protein n=1 Tax=Humisphaera borealis TaxID=2807512 RepID=A0A7M2WYI6_9BACT|nr:amidohydrolase family protein [Humisphaera borealis]QOV90424.1 amidohydrolase family protein [Humisphaera borealis]
MTKQSPKRLFGWAKQSREERATAAVSDAGDLATLREPLWDPVVVIPDPWRRNSEPSAEDIAAWAPRFVWPQTTIADRLFSGGRPTADRPYGHPNDGIGTTVPPATLTSELATLLSAASTMAHDSTDDVRLTRQLLATARAMNLVAASEIANAEAASNLVAATAAPTEMPADVAAEPAEVAVEPAEAPSPEQVAVEVPVDVPVTAPAAIVSVVEEEITAVADVDSITLAGSALATATAEISAITDLLSSVMPAGGIDSTGLDSVDTDAFDAAFEAASAYVPSDDALPAMAARLEWTAERSGFDTVRPPVRAAADPALTSPEAHLDRSSESAQTSTDTATEVSAASDAASSVPEASTTIAETVNLPPVDEVAREAVAVDAGTPETIPAEPVALVVDATPDEPPAIEEASAIEADGHIADSRIDEVVVTHDGTVPSADDSVAESAPTLVPDRVDEPVPEPAVEEANESTSAQTPAPAVVVEVKQAVKTTASTVMAPAVRDEYNRTNIDFRRPWPRPKVRGLVIDFHCHLLARRHAEDWFEAADHYGMDVFVTMSPLEEAVALVRDWGRRLRFIAVPQWGDASDRWVDNWLNRIEAFYNLGSRIAKFHAAPGTMAMRGHRLDSPVYKPLFADVKARGMAIMTHIGDPDTWYNGRYDPAKFGTRDEHYAMWESLLEEHRGHTWIGAHLGGNPEDLPRLQRLLDKFPDLWLDCSATRWMVREISARREPAREFFIRNADRILFGSDQVSGDDRQFDFLASRIWCHRKLWETAYIGPSPIIDPDVPADQQPTVRGLALPDAVLQKIYHDNATRLLGKLGMGFE